MRALTTYQKRWFVAILYYADLVCLIWIVAAHILSFWNISISDMWAFADIAIVTMPLFTDSFLHRRDRLYFARFGEKRRFYTMFTATEEGIRRDNLITLDLIFRYIPTASSAMPYAPRWLVWFGWVTCLLSVPHGWVRMGLGSSLAPEIFVARALIAFAALFFYSLPILYSWQRELVIEPDA